MRQTMSRSTVLLRGRVGLAIEEGKGALNSQVEPVDGKGPACGVSQCLLDGLPGSVGQSELLGEPDNLSQLGLDKGAVHHGPVAGNDDVVVVELREERAELVGMLKGEAAGAVHGWSGGLDNVADDPAASVGYMHDEVGVGVSRAQGLQLDGSMADLQRSSGVDQLRGWGDLDCLPISVGFASAAITPGGQPRPLVLIQVRR